MKAHLAKVSLALLSVAFLLGCQEQGAGPVGPEGLGIQAKRTNPGKKPPKDAGPGSDRLVTITGGLSAQGQPVQVDSDNQKKFVISASAFVGAISLTDTEAAGLGKCVTTVGTDPAALSQEALLALLTDDSKLPRKFIKRFDRHDPSGFNQIQYQWGDQLQLFIGSVPTSKDDPVLLPTVAAENPAFTFTFTAGEVELFSKFGDKASRIRCPLAPGDAVTLVVSPIPK